MERIKAEYHITISDFRRASYYGLFLQHRRPLRIMLVVLAVAVLYGLGGSLGLGAVNYLVFFLAGAYLIWGLLLFGGLERRILRYVKSPESFLDCTYTAVIDSHRIAFEIPERGAQFSTQINKLTCVFELSQMFLIYVSTQDTYILPHRALTEDQRQALRRTFRERLGEHFASRFDRAGKGRGAGK